MRKGFAVFAAALVGLLLLAATASASPVQNVSPYRFPTSCGGFGSAPPVVGASESGGGPVQIQHVREQAGLRKRTAAIVCDRMTGCGTGTELRHQIQCVP